MRVACGEMQRSGDEGNRPYGLLMKNAITISLTVICTALLCVAGEKPAVETVRGKDTDGWTHLVLVRPLDYSVGYGRLDGLNHISRNLSIGGKRFDLALTAHATSSIRYKLAGKCSEFQFNYGLHTGAGGAAVFAVYADGKQIFKTGQIYGYGKTHAKGTRAPVTLNVKGVKVLEMKAFGVRGGAGAWSAWGDPKVR